MPLLDRRSAACTTAMAGIYRRLLDDIAADPPSVYDQRLSLSGWQKAGVAARALAGWRRPAGAGGPGVVSVRVAVVGGGLAGIAAALRCADAGCEVTLLEPRNRLGGLDRIVPPRSAGGRHGSARVPALLHRRTGHCWTGSG